MDSTMMTGRIGSSGRNLRRGEGLDTLMSSGRVGKSQFSVRVMESDAARRRAEGKNGPRFRGPWAIHVNMGKKGGRQSTLRRTAFLWWGQNRRSLGLGTPFLFLMLALR